VSYAVSLLVPPIGRAINPSSCYFIFAAIALAGAIFVIIFVPETKGKSEVEIRALFSGKKTSNDTEMKSSNL
jgi:major inositol transporter-like SP family MFS transporter